MRDLGKMLPVYSYRDHLIGAPMEAKDQVSMSVMRKRQSVGSE
jgi:hypothetical protein